MTNSREVAASTPQSWFCSLALLLCVVETSCKEITASLLTTNSFSVKARQQRPLGAQGNLCDVCGSCHFDTAMGNLCCTALSPMLLGLQNKLRLPLLEYHQKLPQMAWPHFLCYVSDKASKPAEFCQFPPWLLNGGLVGHLLRSYQTTGALHEMSETPLSASRKQSTWADCFTSLNHGVLYIHGRGNYSFLEE